MDAEQLQLGFIEAPQLKDADEMARERGLRLINRIRFQLGGGLIVSAIVPSLLRWPIETFRLETFSNYSALGSAIGTAVAHSLGYVFIRQLIVYPGVRASSFILPTMTVSFGLVALWFLFFRIDYSRYQLGLGFLMAVSWLYFTFYLRNRYAKPVLALVPSGNSRQVTPIAGAEWIGLASPADSLKGVEAVVADLRTDLTDMWERFIANCTLAGIPVYDLKNVVESLTGRVEIEHLSENSFGSVLPSRIYLKVKGLLDVALAVALLPTFAVIILIAAAAIKLESRGPIFFSQPRMGFRGKPFRIYKLRSMIDDGEDGEQFTVEGDSRITRTGKFIRKYRIDEIPQIINILNGEMSWIGPRPESMQLAEWYAREIPFYIYRHAVRPGISGWAQVSQGNVAEVEAASIKLQYDFYYIKNFSPWLDALIVLKTLRTMLTGFGSK